MQGQGALGRAAGLILVAMAIIGVIDNLVVVIAEYAGLWQFHVTRSVFAIPLVVAAAFALRQSLRPVSVRAVALRSGLITCSMLLYFGSLAFRPIAEVAAGLFTAPIFVIIVSILFFNVRVGWVRVASVGLGFAGILLILKPGAEDVGLLSFLPIAAGLFYALNVVVTHHMCQKESTTALLFWFFLSIGGVSGIVLLALGPMDVGQSFFTQGWVTPPPAFLGLAFAQAVGAIIGIGLITRAYQSADASYVSIFEYSLFVYAGVVAYLLRGEVPDLRSIIGIALIVCAGVLIALRTRGERM